MKKIVFLTGAGISAESGIPTFRGAIDGLWENHKVEEVATAKAIKEHPEVVYKFINELRNKYKDCKPNSAHKAIADLEKDYDVTVITQNIDNLHEQAGSSKVIHLHGELNKIRVNSYLLPDIRFDYPEEGITPESTMRGFKVRPDVVLFGEAVPNIYDAIQIIEESDIFVIVGTSLNVYPAASLVGYVDILNPIYYIDPNPAYTPDYPDIKVIKATATEGMKELIKILNKNDNSKRSQQEDF